MNDEQYIKAREEFIYSFLKKLKERSGPVDPVREIDAFTKSISNWSRQYTKTEYEARIAELESVSNLYHELFHEWNEDHEDSCDSWGHAENCKAINIGEAKKAMRLKIESLTAQLAIAEEAAHEANESLLIQHANSVMYYEEKCIPTEDEVMQSFNAHKSAKESLSQLAKMRETSGAGGV